MLNRNESFAKGGISLPRQRKLIAFAEKEEVELIDALGHFGYSLNQLRYETSSLQTWQARPQPNLCDLRMPDNGIPVVSFFSGCGGMDLGFETAGFRHVAAFEINELFCKTLRKNRPSWTVFGPPTSSGDVSKTSETIATLEKIISTDFEGVFTAGPPCQPFSIAANQRFTKSGKYFKRIGFDHETNGSLLFDFAAIVKHFRPACFLIENVAGLRAIDGGGHLSNFIVDLNDTGYKVSDPVVLNAARYGVPQYRERLFFIGTRTRQSIIFPMPESGEYCSGSVLIDQMTEPALNDEIRVHKLSSVKRYMRLDYGKRDHLGRVDRLDPYRPSKTVIAGGTKGGGRSHLHPEIPRTLSVRECARLQTFPDDYAFVGPVARQFTQVGNAVPPALAARLGEAIASSLFGVSCKGPRNV